MGIKISTGIDVGVGEEVGVGAVKEIVTAQSGHNWHGVLPFDLLVELNRN